MQFRVLLLLLPVLCMYSSCTALQCGEPGVRLRAVPSCCQHGRCDSVQVHQVAGVKQTLDSAQAQTVWAVCFAGGVSDRLLQWLGCALCTAHWQCRHVGHFSTTCFQLCRCMWHCLCALHRCTLGLICD